MQSLEHFAHAPQESDGYQRNNTTIAPEIITYLKDECDLREFFVPKPMQGVLSKSFRIEKEEGVAVQIAGNAEVPRAGCEPGGRRTGYPGRAGQGRPAGYGRKARGRHATL